MPLTRGVFLCCDLLLSNAAWCLGRAVLGALSFLFPPSIFSFPDPPFPSSPPPLPSFMSVVFVESYLVVAAPSRFSSLSNAATAGSSVSSTSSVQPSSSTLHQRRSYYRPLEVDLGSNEDTLMPMVDSPSTHPFDARPNIPSPFNRNPQRNSVDSLSSGALLSLWH